MERFSLNACVGGRVNGLMKELTPKSLREADTPKLSVVVPCYNEVESLDELHRRVRAACVEGVGDDFEICLVDDGSTDGTREKITALARTDPAVVGIVLARNHGHQLALSAGLNVCRGELILVIDADLQDPPELLVPMLAEIEKGADVVYGQRSVRHGETAFKKFTAFAFYRMLNWFVDIRIPADTGDFRLMTRRVLNKLNEMPEQHRFIRGMVSWLGFRQVPLEYVRDERFAGTTKYPLKKMVSFAVDAITGFSTTPLRLSIYLGFICAVIGMLFLAYTAYSYFAGITVLGWTTLMSVVLILGSGQLIVLGVIGEYLGRLYMEAKKRPLFVIEEIVTAKDEAKPEQVEPLRPEARADGTRGR